MTGTKTLPTMAVIGLLLLSACCVVKQPMSTEEPVATVTATATATPTPIPTEPLPTDTPVEPTDTPLPTTTDTRVPTSTPLPTATFTPAPTAVVVTQVHVVYHGGIEQDGVGIYVRGVLPWLDLLVRLGDTWFGPEREPDDGIDAQPLLEGYRWECDGGFACHPNGEAWWNETGEEGMARLVGPGGIVLAEIGLKVAFRGGGRPSPTDPGSPPPPPDRGGLGE